MGIGVKAINRLSNSKMMKSLCKPSVAGAASAIALASTTSKDVVATYYYVTQSMKNKKIPEEKRSFVAALDLGNGIMNVITAFAIGLPMKGWMEKLFDKKIAPKYFNEKTLKDNTMKLLEKSKEAFDEKRFQESLSKLNMGKGLARTGLCVLGTLVGSQIIGKRIITPLFATPMADVFEKIFKKDKGDKKPEKELTSEEKVEIVNSQMPQNAANKINLDISAEQLPENFKKFQA
ncbi:hypothetical protein IKA15_02190 [bacterium]|nr:hypothetical protein [bacterium]